MRYKTVNLREETYRRLKMLQTGGKSLSDVIENLIEEVDPVELYAREIEIHRKRMREFERTGGLPVAEVDKRLAKYFAAPHASVQPHRHQTRRSGTRASRTKGSAPSRSSDKGGDESP